jgi:uncharacterized membrane protein
MINYCNSLWSSQTMTHIAVIPSFIVWFCFVMLFCFWGEGWWKLMFVLALCLIGGRYGFFFLNSKRPTNRDKIHDITSVHYKYRWMSSRFITNYLITELVQSAKLILPRKEPYIVPNFGIVMSFIISASKLYSVRLYLQLFAGECMSYLLYLCLLAYSGVQDILCCYFCFVLRLVSYVPNVTSFSGLSVIIFP